MPECQWVALVRLQPSVWSHSGHKEIWYLLDKTGISGVTSGFMGGKRSRDGMPKNFFFSWHILTYASYLQFEKQNIQWSLRIKMLAGILQQKSICIWITCHVTVLLRALLVSWCQNVKSMMKRAVREQHVMQLAVRAVGRVCIKVWKRSDEVHLSRSRVNFRCIMIGNVPNPVMTFVLF